MMIIVSQYLTTKRVGYWDVIITSYVYYSIKSLITTEAITEPKVAGRYDTVP